VLAVNNPMYNEEMGVADFLQQPHVAIIRALLLQFQPTFLDILPLYITLLLVFPLVLIALRRGPLWVLLPSAALYALTQRHGWTLPAYPADHVWFFNPLAWQFLFIIGATAGHARVTGRWPFPHGAWFSQLAVVIAAVLVVINVSWAIHWVYDPFPALLERALYDFTTDKTNLAPLRLLNFLALALATVHFVRPESAFLRWRALQPIILCGQHSLYVFCLGIVLAVFGHFILSEFYGTLAMQLLINLGGFALMIGTAAMLAWYKTAGASGSSVPATPSE
jgi:hypothetical protein